MKPTSPRKICLLPSHVIDHIAAGEVVERPASVAKELVENALDAGATAVSVTLRGGGLDHLAVIDNGCGMSPEQARLCLTRHATSKLACTEDLFHIATLGFRGEALSSIASVSRMRLVTRPAGAEVGYEICVEGGTIVREGAVGSPYGTQMIVDDLFFNTPARRKFMRAPATEQTHLVETVKRVFLGARRGGVCVSHASRRLLDIPEDAQPQQRVQSILGRHVGAFASFEAQFGDVRATGFVGVGQGERNDARNLWLFVNGRFVRDRHLARAVVEAVGQRAWDAPAMVVAYLDLPMAQVDVNVHPQKLEVRFADGRDVFAALGAGVLQGVQALGSVASVKASTRAANPRGEFESAPTCVGEQRAAFLHSTHQAQPHDESRHMTTSQGADLRPLPLGAEYFLCRTQDGTFIVHGPTLARYRALSRWHEELRTGRTRQHALLLPEPLEGRSPWQSWLSDAYATLQGYGFDIAPMGPERFLVRAIPEALASGRPGDIALRFVEVAFRHREQLQDNLDAEELQTLIASCVATLDIGNVETAMAASSEDASWARMRPEDGVVRVTPPFLKALFVTPGRAAPG